MTLKELASNTTLVSEVYDILMWDSETGDYVDTIGFIGADSLADALAEIEYAGEKYREWLEHLVTYMECISDCGHSVLRIEIAM